MQNASLQLKARVTASRIDASVPVDGVPALDTALWLPPLADDAVVELTVMQSGGVELGGLACCVGSASTMVASSSSIGELRVSSTGGSSTGVRAPH